MDESITAEDFSPNEYELMSENINVLMKDTKSLKSNLSEA